MPAERLAPLFLIVSIVAIIAALLQPSPLTLGIALAVLGGSAAFLVAWSVLRIPALRQKGVTEGNAHREKDENKEPQANGEAQEESTSATAEDSSDLIPTTREPESVRDRLRVLLILPQPLDSSFSGEPTRVRWQDIKSALKKETVDLELSVAWPASMTIIEEAMRTLPHYHLVVLESAVDGNNILLEDDYGRQTGVAVKALASALDRGDIRFLILRLTSQDNAPEEEFIGNGLETLVTVPAALDEKKWIEVLVALLHSLSHGEIAVRGISNISSLLDSYGVDSRERPKISGTNWYSLVDRGTDSYGFKTLNQPYSPQLRWQPWFRDRSAAMSALIGALKGSNKKTIVVTGEPGSGLTSIAIELGHRCCNSFPNLLYVDCSQTDYPDISYILSTLAIQLHSRVKERDLLLETVLDSLRAKDSLIIVDGIELLPVEDGEFLFSLADSLPDRSRLILLGTGVENVPGAAFHVTVGSMEMAGVSSWLDWLAAEGNQSVLADISDDSLQALVQGVKANPLAIRLIVGLAGSLGLLQSVRTARSAGSLDGVLDIALSRLGRREVEVATLLAFLPGPTSADILSATLGRNVLSSLTNFLIAGFTVETTRPDLYLLHPYVRKALRSRFPVDDSLVLKLGKAFAAKARGLATRSFAAEEIDEEQRQSRREEMLALIDNMRCMLARAAAEEGILAGQFDIICDIAPALVSVLRFRGLIFEAIEVATIGVEAASRVKDHTARGNLLLEMAESYRESGDLQNAVEYYEQSAQALEVAKNYRGVAEVLIGWGTALWEAEDLAGAVKPLSQALPWLERVRDVRGQINVLTALGDIARGTDPTTAISHYTNAFKLIGQQNDGHDLQAARLRYSIGRCYSQLGDHSTAAREFEAAVEQFAAAHDNEGRAQAYLGLGRSLLRLDDRQRALQALERAAQLEEQSSSSVDASLDLGRAYMRDRRWQDALEHQQRTLNRATNSGDQRGIATAYNGLGNVYLEMGDKGKAINAYEKALAIWHELGNENGLARTYNNLAVAYRRSGHWLEAQRYLEEAARLLQNRGDKMALASVYNNIGLILAMQKKQREAARYYERSLALKEEAGDLYGMKLTQLNLQVLGSRD